ncbi:cytochrome P450 family protein [Pseudonocardia xinjiangensis]|uniref:cytochrome P450 family protein n=1 Tax=Pseudonocardia xinjiangensis TaxID=75289 RepID=UPI003D918A6A
MTTTPSSVEPDLMDPALIADPYGGYGRLREQAPVLRGRTMDGGSAWYVTRQADVRVVLGDPRFVNNPASVPGVEVNNVREKMFEDMLGLPPELSRYVTTSILDTDGADHTRLRKLVSRAFTVRRVNDLRPRVEAITATLLDGLESPAELIEQFAYPLPITVICELVGVPEADRPTWREWGVGLVSMDPKIFPVVIREMVAHVQDLIARRRAEPAADLLTALIQAQEADGDQLSDDELVTMVLTLVIGGHETTAHLLGNGIVALLTHPDQLDLLRRDPSLWPVAVHELMRFCGPVHITRVRYATEDVDLGGVRIRAGEAVQAVLVSANFDPREYTDPERFDLTRRPVGRGEGHVGFGHGFHYCLGAALARQEGEVALRALFERFPDLALVNEEQEWARVPGSRRLTRLPVRLA